MGSDGTAVLLGAPVDDVTVDEAVDRIAAMVELGRMTGRVHQVATVNVDFLVNAQADGELLAILRRTDLAIPDGMPVVWGSRLLRTPLRERTTGVDLVPALAASAAAKRHRLCLFGAAPGVAEAAATALRVRFPGLDVVGLEAPAVGQDGTMDGASLEPLRAVAADIVCVALGNPKQEHWIARFGEQLGCPVYIGIGGTLDFLTGVTQRAPAWMQRSGLEWLHRAVSEPRRLIGRYVHDAVVFVPRLARQAWRGRLARDNGQVYVTTLGDPPVVEIDASQLRRLDNSALATTVGHLRRARQQGVPARVTGLAPGVARSTERLGADGLLGD